MRERERERDALTPKHNSFQAYGKRSMRCLWREREREKVRKSAKEREREELRVELL